MDYAAMVTESFEYAKEALLGKWVRWITFIILALPFALMQFTFDPEKLINKTTGAFNWEQVPWGQLAVLVIIGLLLSFFLAGYMVRVFRGAKPAPDFDNWPGLFVDGLKLNIVWLLWILPFLIVLSAFIGTIIIAFAGKAALADSLALTLVVLLLMFFLAVVFAIIASIYSYLGSIRFARTGSIREGVRLSAITDLIRRIGWVPYIVALLVLCAISFIFSMVVMVLSFIPFIGWLLILVINPFMTLLFGRYAVLVYEQGEIPPAAVAME
jgi:hypothetical protein